MSDPLSPEQVVREFWRLMGTNDFQAVRRVLADDLVVEWPQSRERLRGSETFARMNAEYPTQGTWVFYIDRLVTSDGEVVTQVRLTDGLQSATPVSFFTVRDGVITHMVEFWPEPFVAADNRRHLVEMMPDTSVG